MSKKPPRAATNEGSGGAPPRRRDDFSPRTKQLLSERAAQRCSNPDCRILTKGPTLSMEGAQNAGCAAHISAAAPGGPRYEGSLSPAERSSATNGIWLCRNCGERVDDDEDRYPESLLRKWKADIELEVERALGKPAPLAPLAGAHLSWVVDDERVDALDLTFTRAPSLAAMALRTRYSDEELNTLEGALREAAQEFNEAIDTYCNGVADLEEKHALWARVESDAVELTLELSNPGTAPLKSARVFVTLPNGFTLTDQDHPVTEPDLPRRPRRPKEIEEQLWGGSGFGLDMTRLFPTVVTARVPDLAIESARRMANLTIPTIAGGRWGLEIEQTGRLTGWHPKLTHNLSTRFEDRVRVVPPRTPGTFRAEYEIIADNLPTPVTGPLAITVRERRAEKPAPE